MTLRPVRFLAPCLLVACLPAAAIAESRRVPLEPDFPGMAPAPVPPRRAPPNVFGPNGFGPNGPIFSDQWGIQPPQDSGERPGEHHGPARSGAKAAAPKPPEPDKAEVLRQALAPKPSDALLRSQRLDELFGALATASDEAAAKGLTERIEWIWGHSPSETANLLMTRGKAALAAGHYPLALSLFDKLILLQPQWAEAWNERAMTRFKADDLDGAMADINQVLKLEPRHYGALAGLGAILQKSNLDKQALEAFRKVLSLNPQQGELRKIIDSLSIKVEGRDI